MFNHLVLVVIGGQPLGERRPLLVLIVPLLIDGDGHAGGAEREHDLALVHMKDLGELFDGGLFAALRAALLDIGVHVARRLLHEAGDLDAAVVAQKTLDLPSDHRDGVGRKAHAEALVKACDRL